MRKHPRDQTIYQLKQSIATDKKRLEEYEREWRNSNMKDKRARARMNNAGSLIRTAEFQLQRKIDEIKLTAKSLIKIRRKGIISDLDYILSRNWSESDFLIFEKEVRNFIQNYNEL